MATSTYNITGANNTAATSGSNTKSSTTTKSSDNAAGSTNALSGTSATAKGTPIVKAGETLDNNSFFKILAAELSNQDPTQPQDTTAYISQMAQFTSLEQMTALNGTMTLSAAQGLTGKFVGLDVADDKGIQQCGEVRGVYKFKNQVYVSVEDVKGVITNYKYSQVTNVFELDDLNMDNLTFSNASTLIGKTVDISVPVETDKDKDKESDPSTPKFKTVTGEVTEVYRDGEGIKLKVQVEVDGKTQINDYLFNSVISVKG